MKISQFNKQNLPQLRIDLNNALKAVAELHGIDLSLGNMSFTDTETTVKLTARVKSNISLNTLVNWRLKNLGLPEDLMGKSFVFKNKTYTVTSLNTKPVKYPVEAKTLEGRTVCFATEFIKTLLPA